LGCAGAGPRLYEKPALLEKAERRKTGDNCKPAAKVKKGI